MMDIGAFASGFTNIGIVIIVGLFVGGVSWLGIHTFQNNKKYNQYNVTIWELNEKNEVISESYDKAGIFVERKTGHKLLFLKKWNVGLCPDNIPCVNLKNQSKATIYLGRKGLKNFYYIKMPKVLWNEDGKPVPPPTLGEEDLNWAHNSMERLRRLHQTNLLLQYLPFILLAFVSIIILIIFIYFFKSFDSLKELGANMVETAKILKGSGTIIPAGGAVVPA